MVFLHAIPASGMFAVPVAAAASQHKLGSLHALCRMSCRGRSGASDRTRAARRFDHIINAGQQHTLGDLFTPDGELHLPKVSACSGGSSGSAPMVVLSGPVSHRGCMTAL
jgi:hypothetical protein